jgi:hypothetical protein
MGHAFCPHWGRVALVVALMASMAQASIPEDALTRAHRAYNAGQYDTAIAAARDALKQPERSNAAAVVLARALLDRYRAGSVLSDLDDAREVLANVRPAELAPRDHVAFLLGLGLVLYHDGCDAGCFNTAAEFFAQALDRMTSPEMGDSELVFEWWANSLDRHALYSPEADRAAVYRRILERAERERAERAQSTSAAYWIAAASRGAGDLDRAWSAALSGWINARYQGARGDKLRADLDYLVEQVILPDRANAQMADGDARLALAHMLKQWEDLKAKYK